MNAAAVGVSTAGFAAVMIAWGTYLATIPSGKVPVRPVGWIALQFVGIAMAVSAILWSMKDGGSPGLPVIIPAVFAIMMGSTFFYLLSQRKTPIGDLKVKVGDQLPQFSVTASDGSEFQSTSLAGQRTLLKFFRGGW